MTTLTQPNTLGDGLKYEEPNFYSREKVTVLSGQNLALLEVVGKILTSCPTTGTKVQEGTYTMTATEGGGSGAVTTPATGTADAGNTGNGTMGTVSAGASAQAGTYTMTCVDATVSGSEVFSVVAPNGATLPNATVGVAYANAQINFTIADGATDFIVGDIFTVAATAADGNVGTFAVKAPDGTALPDATVAVAYSNEHINFTIADGATDYAVGDIFTVAVAAGSGKVKALNLTGVDGSQRGYGIMCLAVDASSADKEGAAVVRNAQIASANLVWPDGISAGQKATALAELAEAGVIAATLA